MNSGVCYCVTSGNFCSFNVINSCRIPIYSQVYGGSVTKIHNRVEETSIHVCVDVGFVVM